MTCPACSSSTGTTGDIAHRRFFDLPEYLRAGDVLVLNDTRVSAQRLFGARPGRPGEVIETFLTHRVADGLWQALGRPGASCRRGRGWSSAAA